jgi:hypothetical protein
MKNLLWIPRALGVAAIAVAAPMPGGAAPGDPVALRGTLAWPPAPSAEPFAVVRADDGRFYDVDIGRAERHIQGLRAGERVSLLGVEGSRPWEVGAVALARGDAAFAVPPAGDEPAASPPTEAAGARPPRERRPWQRTDGTVHAVRDRTLAVRTADGRTVDVDLGRLGAGLGRDLARGAPVTVFAVTEHGRLTAVGLLRTDAGR